MQGSVRKKSDEVDLWEIVTTQKKGQPKRKPRVSYDLRDAGEWHSAGTYADDRRGESDSRSEQARSGSRNRQVQIIGEREYENRRLGRQNRPSPPREYSRQAQSGGRSRSAQPRSEVRRGQARSGSRSRSVQIIGEEEYGYDRPRRQGRQAPPREYSRQAQSDRRRRQERAAYAARRKKARRRRALFYRASAFVMIVCCMILASALIGVVYRSVQEWKKEDDIPVVNVPVIHETEKEEGKVTAPYISTDLLEINDFSRPGTELREVNSIFVHYTANPKTSAAQNRSYFANLAQTHERPASAHYIIGYEGEILQCIPSDEQAYAVISRNEDSLSIECCYLDEDGEFTKETYDSLVHMLAWLLQEYQLESSDILRHYDCGGKLCPLYYVEHEDAWDKLLADVDAYIEEHTKPVETEA